MARYDVDRNRYPNPFRASATSPSHRAVVDFWPDQIVAVGKLLVVISGEDQFFDHGVEMRPRSSRPDGKMPDEGRDPPADPGELLGGAVLA
ncbi:hypothetical protein [Micromonospora craterilacus]|uniref:hypothetical protein n=1 Tax=Micromonospora craterilacus TaxID=1655439 RepID=UPI001313DAB5|nr:hypothetical protein [Micromonospora craterilacus]